ncbi:MAG: hypothetical protein AB7E30_06500 [Lawsonibacter sp.]
MQMGRPSGRFFEAASGGENPPAEKPKRLFQQAELRISFAGSGFFLTKTHFMISSNAIIKIKFYNF